MGITAEGEADIDYIKEVLAGLQYAVEARTVEARMYSSHAARLRLYIVAVPHAKLCKRWKAVCCSVTKQNPKMPMAMLDYPYNVHGHSRCFLGTFLTTFCPASNLLVAWCLK